MSASAASKGQSDDALLARRPIDGVLRAALERLRRAHDVRYAEVRYVSESSERLRVRDLRPEDVATASSRGVAVRVLGDKTWGFACTPHLDEPSVVHAAERALLIARASAALASRAVTFPPASPSVGSYRSAVAIDPSSIPIAQKLAFLDAPVRALMARGKPIRSAEAWMDWTHQTKRLLTTEGTDVTQTLTFGACGMQVIAIGDDGISQRRTYPTWQGSEGFQGGYEHVASLDLLGNVDRIAEEAIALLTAPPCPPGTRDVILDSNQTALQIHESCGHPTELDRAMGSEISLAGGSFLQPALLGSLRYGSPHVDLVADSTSAGGMGTFGWDDEGVAAGKRHLVREGMFVDYLSSRETAASLGRASTGTMRAESWNRPPLIRMVNVSLEPREGSLDALVNDTDDGLLISTDRSWSIDDLRLNFQFTCEIAWEIKRGKRTRILRDPLYTGITPSFWRSCDAVCGADEWRLWGITNCGKGDPMQIMQVGHGASPARFRGVTVGPGGAQ
jgi:TldD protein